MQTHARFLSPLDGRFYQQPSVPASLQAPAVTMAP